MVVCKTSVLKVFLRLCCEQFTAVPPCWLLPQLLTVLNQVAKPSEGGGGGSFLEVIAPVQRKSRRGTGRGWGTRQQSSTVTLDVAPPSLLLA